MGHIQKRGQGKYLARYRDPSGRERSKQFDKRKHDKPLDAARRFLLAQQADVASGTWTDPSRGQATVAELAEQWLAGRVDLQPSSRERLRSTLDTHVLPAFGARRVASISHADIEAWIARLSAAGMAPLTVKKTVQGLSGLLAWCARDRRITANPAIGVRMPARQRPSLRIPETHEVAELAAALPDRYRVLILTAAFAGLRWGELAGLRRSRVDALRSRITVDQTAVDLARQPVVFGPPKTAGSHRTVPAYPWLIAELESHMAAYTEPGPDALVFTRENGEPLRRAAWRGVVWLPAIRACGLDGLRPHDLRHHCASLWIAEGFSIKEVSVWLGHASIAITGDTYAHEFAAREEEVTARLSRAVPEMPAAPSRPRAVPIKAKTA